MSFAERFVEGKGDGDYRDPAERKDASLELRVENQGSFVGTRGAQGIIGPRTRRLVTGGIYRAEPEEQTMVEEVEEAARNSKN